MWICNKCGGEIVRVEGEVISTTYTLNRNLTNKKQVGIPSSLASEFGDNYECCKCGMSTNY